MKSFRLIAWAALLALGLSAEAGGQTVLRVSTWVPPEHEVNRTLFPTWGRSIERATDGRVRIAVEYDRGAPNRQLDLVREGRVDIGYVFHGYHPDRFLLPRLAELPGTGVDQVASSVALWRVWEEHLARAREHDGVTVLGMMLHGPGVLHLKAPIVAISELRGRRIRVPGGISAEIGAALGVVPVSLSPNQAYAAIVDGRAEGAFFPMESKESYRLKEVVRFSLEMPAAFYDGSFAIVMNRARLAAMSENDRAAVLAMSGERLSAISGRAWRAADAAGRAGAEAFGNVLTVADAAMQLEFEALFGPIEAAWITRATRERGIDARRVLAAYRSIARTYSE